MVFSIGSVGVVVIDVNGTKVVIKWSLSHRILTMSYCLRSRHCS